MKKLQLALAGAGLIGRTHIDLINQHPECELIALVDPSPAAQALAVELRLPLFDSLEQLFALNKPDGVILATPNQLHVQQAIQCIDAGVAALIEKPVAHTLAAGAELLAYAEGKAARLLVGHHRTHSAIMQQARAAIDAGLLGDLVAVSASALFYKPDDYFDAAPWRRQAGGGPILINLIHEIGNLRYLCGEITEVQAMASNARRGFPVEDTVAINLRFDSGVLASFMLSDSAACARSWEQTSGENPAYAHYADEDCYVIAGTRGTLAVPSLRLKRYGKDVEPSWWNPFESSQLEREQRDPLAAQLDHFCALIRGETAPRVSIEDGFQNLLVTEAIREAAQRQRAISLPDYAAKLAQR